MNRNAQHLDQHNTYVHGFILAGGEGLRMGGKDKGLIEYAGQSLAATCAQNLAPQVSELTLIANRNLEQYRRLGFPVYSDDQALVQLKRQGPLAGVLTALRNSHSPYIAVVPCDAPNIAHNLIARLLNSLASHTNALVSLPMVLQRDGSQQAEPAFMLIKCLAKPHLEKYFASGGRSLKGWALAAGLCYTHFNHLDDWRNFQDIDSPDILEILSTQATPKSMD